MSPILYMALAALFLPRTGFSALPPPLPTASGEPAGSGASESAANKGSKASGAGSPSGSIDWVMPRIRWGGNISYDARSSSGSEGQKSMQRDLMLTLRAATDTFIWQPWFSRISGNLNLTTSRNSAQSSGGDVNQEFGGKSVALSGSGQLNILPYSRFPFEAHVTRTNSTVTSDLSLPLDYTSQQMGFTQRFRRNNGDAMLSFERARQSSGSTGTDRQDVVQAAFSHNLKNQRIQLTGNASDNRRDGTGDYAKQTNLTLQHSYSADSTFSLDSMANATNTNNFLGRSQSEMHLNQLNSQGFWRSSDRPLLLNGGARLLTVTSAFSGPDMVGGSQNSRVRTANANAGGSYDITQYLHFNATANVGVTENQDRHNTSSSESAGLNYAPASRALGEFLYSWSVSGGISNYSGDGLGGHRENVQFNQGLSRNFNLDDSGASIGIDAGQMVSVARDSVAGVNDIAPTRMLTHNAGVSWSRTKDANLTMVRLSASDSRGLDGNQEYFQMLNLQLFSNVQSGSYSSWSGNLTMQATRQGASAVALPSATGETGNSSLQSSTSHHSFTTTSSGAVSYQNSRFFGVRNLRFTSDLRLNSMALLPVLGGPKDQETAAWENRFTYGLGRTQFSVTTLIARSVVPIYGRNPDGTEQLTGSTRTNKAIMFSLMRSFGNY